MRKEGPCAVSSGCSLAFRHPRRPGGGAAVQSQWELVSPRSGSIVERDCSGRDSAQRASAEQVPATPGRDQKETGWGW